jgi:hypothetical protein
VVEEGGSVRGQLAEVELLEAHPPATIRHPQKL